MYTIQELCDRYQITSRNTLYSRLSSLKRKGIEINLVKYKGKSFAQGELTKILDEQDQWLKNGGTLDNFEVAIATSVTVEAEERTTVGVLPRTALVQEEDTVQRTSAITPELIKELAIAISDILAPYLPKQDPFWYLDKLQALAASGVQISTSEVKYLIGVTPRGKVFQRGSFKFVKVGKIGRESGWKVELSSK